MRKLIKKAKLKNKVYDILKWVAILLLPTLAWFYGEIAPDWNLPYPQQIVHTINTLGTFLGLLLGLSTLNYQDKGGE